MPDPLYSPMPTTPENGWEFHRLKGTDPFPPGGPKPPEDLGDWPTGEAEHPDDPDDDFDV